MVNNFKQIRELLEFRSEDDFYFLQILQRKKDHKDNSLVVGSNNNSRLIRPYYISSLDYFDRIENEVIQLCNLFNARAGINLNKRSYEKMALQHLRKVTDQIINKNFNKSHKAYPSVVGAYNHESDKKWILDIDDYKTEYNFIEGTLKDIMPLGNKVITTLESKSGYHIITKPFDVSQFRKRKIFDDVEIHKNNPTNLYIP